MTISIFLNILLLFYFIQQENIKISAPQVFFFRLQSRACLFNKIKSHLHRYYLYMCSCYRKKVYK